MRYVAGWRIQLAIQISSQARGHVAGGRGVCWGQWFLTRVSCRLCDHLFQPG